MVLPSGHLGNSISKSTQFLSPLNKSFLTSYGCQTKQFTSFLQNLFWYNSLSDSSNIDSVLSISQTPFNWNDDTTFSTKEDLKDRIIHLLTNTGHSAILIDSVFDSPDGFRQFKNSDLSKITVIEIWYYPRNSLRTHSMLIAISKVSHQKVVGFKLEGSLLRRRRQ